MTFNFQDERPSLAGFGYQDPEYSAWDGMSSPGYLPTQTYNTSLGSVSASDPLSAIQQAANKNNAWSAEQAANQNAFQVEQNEKAMKFSAEQAAINRDWQKMMSDTAHQREIVDLQKAGLNPVLSASGGNGASVGSGSAAAGVTSAGAKGDTDESLTMALMSYMAQQMQAQTAIMNSQTSANATLANAELMSSASRYAADLSYALGMNEPGHAAAGIVKDIVDPAGAGLGVVAVNAAKSASGKVVNWLKNVYQNTIGRDRYAEDHAVHASTNRNGHYSSKFEQSQSNAVEQAVANARGVLSNAAQSSGLNLWNAIDKATNGSLTQKALSKKK